MVEANNGGKKYDTGKAPLFRGCLAYFASALVAVSQVSEYGANKYQNFDYANKWSEVSNGQARYTDADARHLLSESTDGMYDPESGLLHAAHHAWNALARLVFILRTHPIKKPIAVDPQHPMGQHAEICKCEQCLPTVKK